MAYDSKSGLEKIFLKFLHAGDYFSLLHKSVQNHKFSNKNNHLTAWRDFKIIFSRPLFTIVFRPKNIFLDTCFILSVKTIYESVKDVLRSAMSYGFTIWFNHLKLHINFQFKTPNYIIPISTALVIYLGIFFFNIAVMRLNSNSSMERSRTRILDDENFDETDLKSLDTNRRKVTLDPGLLDDLLNFR